MSLPSKFFLTLYMATLLISILAMMALAASNYLVLDLVLLGHYQATTNGWSYEGSEGIIACYCIWLTTINQG